MNSLLQDLRLSFRLLAKSPGFTATAIVVLALGIGVNTAIFSVVHAMVYSARPFPNPQEVVQLYTQDKKKPTDYRLFSYPVYRELREQRGQFTGILAHNLSMVGIGEGADARRTFAAIVSSNYFDVLGVKLARGRPFSLAEEAPGSARPVAIASYIYWKKTGFDPGLVGSTIRVNERPFTVIGIAPENFTGTMMLFGPELYFPLGMYDQLTNDFQAEARRTLERRDAYNLFLVGRLAPGASPESAKAALATYAASLEKAFPVEQKDQTFTLGRLPRLSTNTNPQSENQLGLIGLLLLGMTAVVLLIACLNLASLLLARGAARRKEFAIRLALGGGRARIVRQLLTEGLVLSLAGGLGGLVLALWSSNLLMGSMASLVPVTLFFSGTANPAILAATLGFCAIATIFFALGPALKFSRGDVLGDLKEQAGEDTRPRRRWLPRNPLVVAQIALSLGLLTCAGLFVRGAAKAGGADIGFHADDTIIVEADASLGGYDQTRSRQIYRNVSDRLAALPGVQSASIASTVPFGMISLNRPVQRAGLHPAKDAKPATAAEGLAYDSRWNSIGADYFATLGLPILRGRAFTKAETENAGGPAVAIISENLARNLWPDGDALGQRIQYADRNAARAADSDGSAAGASDHVAATKDDTKTIEVVGIVPDITTSLFSKKNREYAIYVPFGQGFQSNVQFHVRTAANTAAVATALIDVVRREVREAAPGVPVFKVRTFRQHLAASADLWITRIGATLFSVFGGLALALAAVGLYGVKAYSVARRIREIGIRMALGAQPGRVQAMILREGLAMTLTGAVLGLLLALGLGRICAGLLYEVSPMDPLAFAVAPAVLLATALLACWVPARKATKVSPLSALRAE
ncbi:MAG TPA: ADOP family duplicated permease [Lacunisphaera sp.]|jgi:predicted permease|nr:ADOP family duplicated permease [Lacunisphaera sp.]